MPSTLFTEMDHNTDGLEDHQTRALQSLAFNLSMLGLSGNEDDGPSAMDDRGRKSSNMTECVPVPSSEHVAEIVGRQGTIPRIYLHDFFYCENYFSRVFFQCLLSSVFICVFKFLVQGLCAQI